MFADYVQNVITVIFLWELFCIPCKVIGFAGLFTLTEVMRNLLMVHWVVLLRCAGVDGSSLWLTSEPPSDCLPHIKH